MSPRPDLGPRPRLGYAASRIDRASGRRADDAALAVLEREAFENGAHVSAMGSRRRLVGALAEGVDRGGHVGGAEKGLVIRVDEGSEGSFARSHFYQFDILMRLPMGRPSPAAFLEHP